MLRHRPREFIRRRYVVRAAAFGPETGEARPQPPFLEKQ
jgi:hypothetical protein